MTAKDYVAHTDTISIATATHDGKEIVTPIWGVVLDGVPYIRSAYEGSRWYQRAQRDRRITLVDGSDRYATTLENVDDEQVIGEVDAAYEAKYTPRWGRRAVRTVLTPLARRRTMRLITQ